MVMEKLLLLSNWEVTNYHNGIKGRERKSKIKGHRTFHASISCTTGVNTRHQCSALSEMHRCRNVQIPVKHSHLLKCCNFGNLHRRDTSINMTLWFECSISVRFEVETSGEVESGVT